MVTKPKARRQTLDESGQSTIEFALTLILLMSFVFFFVQLSLVFGYGNYAHYATFMSARAYLSAGPDDQDQIERARAVIVRMLKRSEGQAASDRFPFIAQGVGGQDVPGFKTRGDQYKPGVRALSWMEGVRYTFRSRLFLIPLAGTQSGGSQGNSPNSVTLTSESWLGRDPTYSECQTYMGGPQGGIFDNGC